MLTHFTYIIHSITVLQTENEIYFSPAVIYIALRHANLYVEILHSLIFINGNSTNSGLNTHIDVFGGYLYAVAYIVYEIQSGEISVFRM